MENQIDDFFKVRLADAEVCPDPVLWNQIDKAMKRRKEIRFRTYSAAAMLAFAAAALFILWNDPSRTKPESLPISVSETEPVTQASDKNEINPHTPAEVSVPATIFYSDIPRRQEFEAADASDDQASEHVSLQEPNAISLINENVMMEDAVQDLPLSGYPDSEVIVFELISSEDMIPEMSRQSRFFKSVKSVKRDGISLGAVQDLKNEILSKLNRNRQRSDESETKIQITEQ